MENEPSSGGELTRILKTLRNWLIFIVIVNVGIIIATAVNFLT